MIAGIIFLYQISHDLVSLTELERIEPDVATQVYSADGEILHSFFTYNRTYTPFDKIPKPVIDALLAAEDRDFYDHWGIHLTGILRALIVDVMHMEIKQGASTISMQLARNLYFGLEQTMTRKLKEALTAIQIERTYAKNEILEMYCNVVFFGNNAYGIQAAARRYFDKKVEELTSEEAALLVGVLKGQTLYSPIRHPQNALNRRNVVLKMMQDYGKLTQAQFDSLKQLDLNLTLNDPNRMKSAPYFTEHIRRQMNKLQDSLGVKVYEDGLRVYTTLNTEMQNYMEASIAKHIDRIQERVRAQKAFDEYRKTMTDSAFNEMTTVQIAFTAINPHNGHILAMVGGRDFYKSNWNRVTQAKRQPGSAFKPFLYTAAIDNGYSPADEYLNQPTVEINPDGTRWTPVNFDGKVSGLMPLREALYRSINLVAVRLITDITPNIVARYARRMGISTPVRPYSALALGSSDVIPLELVSAYGTFANNGVHVKPISILRIEDKNGNVIYQARPEKREVLSEETVFIINDMLQDVIRRGTGYGVRRDYKFYSPAGGKTGTTNDNTNAWFVGFTPDLVAGVWVGLDDFKLGLGRGMTGAVAALPFWGEFMKTVYDSLSFPKHRFHEASGVVKLRICRESKKLATPYCPETYEELYNINYQPADKCDIHTGTRAIKSERRKRF
jgi:penicillin-binding protein 1A